MGRTSIILAMVWIGLTGLSPVAATEPAGSKGERIGLPATGIDVRAEEVGFSNGEVPLAATLLLPSSPGPHPAVVFLPGSGPHTRDDARIYAEHFAAGGLAVLFYDKRGNGSSGGDWTRASLDDLARDGLAAIEVLSRRADIDPARIGLWAPSQGAWVASVLSTLRHDIAFLLVMSGGGITPRESELWSYERALDRRGVREEDRAEARALLDAYFSYLASGRNREALVQRIDQARTAPWYEALNVHRILPSEANRPNWTWVATYDPLPAISAMTFPVLLLFGAEDEQQPTHRAIARWREGLQRAVNDRWVVMTYAGADHAMRIPPSGPGHPSGAAASGGHADAGADHSPEGHPGGQDATLAAGFLDSAVGWARAQAGLGEPVEVRAMGSLRSIFHEGRLSAATRLEDWTPSTSLVAVGALSELRGEITAVDGRIYVARPADDGSSKTVATNASAEEAVLLVLAHVPRWIQVSIQEDIPFEALDDAIRAIATRAGITPERPFPFVIEGHLRDLTWHTIDGRRVEPGGGHETHLRAGIREKRAEAEVSLVGFHSDTHQGVFTHRGSSTHIHVVAREPLSSGHVDHVVVPAGATLRLPAP